MRDFVALRMSKFGLTALSSLMILVATSGVVLAPQPQVTFLNLPYHEGDTVTVQWSCDISTVRMEIVAWMSGVEIHGDIVSGKTQGLETFVAPMSGLLNLRVSCIDSEGRGIGNDESISIHPVVQANSGESGNIDWTFPIVLLIVGGMVILVLTLMFRTGNDSQ